MTNLHNSLQEIWRDVPGYEGRYQVSNIGNIKTHTRHVKVKGGALRLAKSQFIATHKIPSGYIHVVLSKDDKKFQTHVHRLVAMAFIPNPENKSYVNHIDANKANNNVSNLEWCTMSENMQHAVENKLTNTMIGTKNPKVVLTEDQARKIKSLCKTNTTQEILRIMGFKESQKHLVANIRCGRLWKHLLPSQT